MRRHSVAPGWHIYAILVCQAPAELRFQHPTTAAATLTFFPATAQMLLAFDCCFPVMIDSSPTLFDTSWVWWACLLPLWTPLCFLGFFCCGVH